MAGIRKTVAHSVSEMDKLRPLWNELLRHCPKTMFQRFAWNRLAAQMFRDRFSPMVCAVESDNGAAIIPAALNREANWLELLGETLFDYRSVLHAGDRNVLHVAWEMLEALDAPLWLIAMEEEEAKTTWSDFSPVEYARAPWVDASKITAEQFRHAHARAARQLRRLHKAGVSLHQYSGAEHSMLERIYRLKGDQFPGDINNVFRDQQRRGFMVAIAAAEAENCRVLTLEDAVHSVVAALVTFADGGMRRFYTTYFNPDWAVYSPGVALLFEATALALEQGFSCDYMTGEYPYKLRFANASRRLYRIDLSASEFVGIVRRQVARRAA